MRTRGSNYDGVTVGDSFSRAKGSKLDDVTVSNSVISPLTNRDHVILQDSASPNYDMPVKNLIRKLSLATKEEVLIRGSDASLISDYDDVTVGSFPSHVADDATVQSLLTTTDFDNVTVQESVRSLLSNDLTVRDFVKHVVSTNADIDDNNTAVQNSVKSVVSGMVSVGEKSQTSNVTL